LSRTSRKLLLIVYYESRKRDLQTRPIYECRCDERLKTKSEKSTRLTYTGLFGELEHLKIETRLIDEMFESVMGEYVYYEPRYECRTCCLLLIDKARAKDKTYI
jgi:hypothetical protein